ncbi:MAG: protein translocase subunit SecD [Planctomycetes bacterium]|nr:protein translocase subunit SecD [Planctomycetota bacterium]
MNENLGRKITITVVLIAAALASIAFWPLARNEKPWRLGLDLQGGTRLVFRFDFDEAARRGQISSTELADKAALLASFREIIHNRIDPKGVREISLRTQGLDQLVIELPGAADFGGTKVFWKLAADVALDAKEIVLDPGPPASVNASQKERTDAIEAIKAFPLDGGLVRIGSEQLEYASREGNVLRIAKRGAAQTTASAHTASENIELLSGDELIDLIVNVGDMQFMIAAEQNDAELSRSGTELTRERQKLDDWMRANPGADVDGFNRLAGQPNGPAQNLRWYPMRIGKGQPETPMETRLRGLLVSSNEEWRFSGADLERVEPSQDELGYPAVRLEISNAKKRAFGDFSEANLRRGMAIVLNGEIATLATINDKLPGSCVISGGSGGFTQKEVTDLVSVLKSGSLRVKPVLQDRARVGASLGADYVQTGVLSMGVALGVIILFMLVLYRKLGVYSVIGLVLNLLFLMGALAFMRATLTLPGVAGLILTLGMAVDGNILIYERLREELARGMKPIQACKAAFERAAVTIIDSNLTTLIAGVILYYTGTGPIRGFAVTLNVGILSTLFTVIVVTELLVFLDLKKGSANLSMAQVFATPKIAFMKTYKIFLGASWIFVAVGIALFAWLPENEKLGIDFLGGLTMKVRTAEPMQIEDLRGRISKIEGALGKAEVKQIGDSASGGGGFTLFSVTYKHPSGSDDSQAQATIEAGERQIKEALAGILAPNPVLLTVTPGDALDQVSGTIDFESAHPTADIGAVLASKGLQTVAVQTIPGSETKIQFSAGIEKGRSNDQAIAIVSSSFVGKKDAQNSVFSLRSPIPESSVVGKTVGAELRNKAVIALVLSLLGTLLYLRIRFAEVGYGVAVVVALVHDVFMTLTWISLAVATGLVQAEIDLSMIAAFLTIIGYSQNDSIVIFDRVRENRAKSNAPLIDILNDSINQTLARTILTTSTVVLTLLVLFLFNFGTRNVLEGFSFAMLVGVLSGAYSTVYIASPVLLWFERRQAKKGGGSVAGTLPENLGEPATP